MTDVKEKCKTCGHVVGSIFVRFEVAEHLSFVCRECQTQWVKVTIIEKNHDLLRENLVKLQRKYVGIVPRRCQDVIRAIEKEIQKIGNVNPVKRRYDILEQIELKRLHQEVWDE